MTFKKNTGLAIAAIALLVIGGGIAVQQSGLSNAQTAPAPQEPALDFTIPEITPGGQKTSREGCPKPAEPEWAVTASTPTDARKALILTDIYDIQTRTKIIDSGSCDCETKYPAWEEAQSEYERLMAELGDNYHDKASDLSRQSSKLLKQSLEICRSYWSDRT